MIFQFVKLEMLKFSRSNAFARSVAVAIFLGFLALLLLSYVFILGISMPYLLQHFFEGEQPVAVLNRLLVYFFLFEFIYRYFMQSLPVVELESFLHHPVKKRFIVNFLLIRSFISPFTIIAVLLFLPFAVMELAGTMGRGAALSWLGTVVLLSWSMHYLVLWFKLKYDDSLWSVVALIVVMSLSAGASYFGWFELGVWLQPFFAWALVSWLPLVLMAGLFALSYGVAYRFYRQNAYVEDLTPEEQIKFGNSSIGFFERFGLAGEFANLEWKLILRHKKSRTYLNLAGFFLLYGLIFYRNQDGYIPGESIPYIWIFVGSFITGIFVLQYGQLFLSWNSSNFDFFLQQKGGVEALVKGKLLLFSSISFLCLLLSVPYLFFGWDILLIHLVMFCFNLGVTMHLVVLISLWKPKPMDLNKGAMFNYEGVGMAQFLMVIPMMIAPYLIYVPITLIWNGYVGLLALAVVGVIGMLCFPQLTRLSINKILANKYEISSSFRQEI